MESTMCPKCGIVLSPKEENEIVSLHCGVCGFNKEYKDWVEHLCTKCSHGKAIVIYHAMSPDDTDTTIYKCISCGTTDKEELG
jgi:DNA-directed RNA polymerase subunit M/transcription elongation factor TFIIS